MDEDSKAFFRMTVEIRILTSVLARISHRSIEERFSGAKTDVSGLQYGILRALSHESCTLSDLSKRFMLDPSTLVPVIDTLERKGLVMRGKDPHDRRRNPLALTEDGAQLVGSIPLYHEDDLLYRSLGSLGPDKAYQLRDLLRELITQLPEGNVMLEAVTSRLYALQADENVTIPPDCSIQHGQRTTTDEQNPRKPRSSRRQARGSRRHE